MGRIKCCATDPTSREEQKTKTGDQLTTAGPDLLEKFCKILRNNKRRAFMAERLEESEGCHSEATSM